MSSRFVTHLAFAAVLLSSETRSLAAAQTPSGKAIWVTTGNAVAGTIFTSSPVPLDDSAATIPFTGGYEVSTDYTPGNEFTSRNLERRLLLPFDVSKTTSTNTKTLGLHTGIYAPIRNGNYGFGYHADNGADSYLTSADDVASVTIGDAVPDAVPEPGILITVISFGFMTGVALLRGQSRIAFTHS